MQRLSRVFLVFTAFVAFALLACSPGWEFESGTSRGERPAATSTPAITAKPAVSVPARLMAPVPPPTPAVVSSQELRRLSTEEQLAQIIAPVRDLRDLALRLDPGVEDIPVVVNAHTPDYPVGERMSFWVHDLEANANFEITAELVEKTDVAYVWIEEDREFDREAIIRSVQRFSEHTYPAVRAFFGSEWNPGVDNDPRLHILHAYGLGSGIAGYFSSADEYSRLARPFSNEKEMFYINLEWLNSARNYDYYETVLAHELQHMIHWYKDRNEETWVNEGLSEFAQEVAGYDPGTIFAGVFARNPDTQLNTWGQEQGNNGVHYGASYLFMAYFSQRFGSDMTRALVAHPANGIRGFDAVLEAAGLRQNGRPLRFDDLFADWVVANYVDDPNALGADGVYGYRAFTQDAPVVDASYNVYPAEPRTTTVNNYAADYVLLKGRGDVTVHFEGQTATRLANLPPTSGAYCWWSNRGDDFDTRLTRRFDLSAADPALPLEMHVTMWWDIEPDYDYGYVLASRDGKKWEPLAGANTSTEDPGGNAFGPGYTGQSGGDASAWVVETFDLAAYAGEEIWVRFEYVTDDAVNASGWFIDQVAIPALAYHADFESGADGWSSEGWLLTDNRLDQRWLLQVLTLDQNLLSRVERVPVDADGRARINIAGLGNGKTVVLAISALAPVTTEPAEYTIRIDRRP